MADPTFHDVILSVVCALISGLMPALFEIRSKIRDLHDWHKPDDRGRQRWRDRQHAGKGQV